MINERPADYDPSGSQAVFFRRRAETAAAFARDAALRTIIEKMLEAEITGDASWFAWALHNQPYAAILADPEALRLLGLG